VSRKCHHDGVAIAMGNGVEVSPQLSSEPNSLCNVVVHVLKARQQLWPVRIIYKASSSIIYRLLCIGMAEWVEPGISDTQV
jgi:hypothetical protein